MKFILHSVSYSSAWEGQIALSLEKVIDKAADLGYDGIEIMAKRPHASVLDLSEPDRKRIREQIAARGLVLPCIAGYQDFADDPLHPDMPKGEKELLFLRESIRLTRDLGAKILRIYSCFVPPDISRSTLWRQCVKYLKEGVRYAEESGIVLALQNHSELTLHHLDLLRMIEEVDSPNLRIALDPPYICMSEASYERAVDDCRKHIVYSTASDFIRIPNPVNTRVPGFLHYSIGYFMLYEKKTVPLGQGDVDYPKFFSALKKIGYDDYLAYEICSPIIGGGSEESLDRSASASLAYMREAWNKA
ncbi:MAG: sugar phosphate isomerase/epimerase [Deltaproteobacteria bacterium]|nr:sugar phosphate isomerase/epimerase [Deltaproteobacteria bacterium]